jgi:hypothetical protein
MVKIRSHRATRLSTTALELDQVIRGTEAVFVRRTEPAVVRRTEAAVAIEASSPQLKEPPTQSVGFGSDTLPRSWFLSRRRGGVVKALLSAVLTPDD